ncbi:hypothetical protein [Paenibacillus harenae]|uniref:DUF2157 domain-containing protein n=1 Tax=Paenibacillus harenae TaxID=306543 RepID=A0ABT9TWF4_PAEHA|nr:hypothetical protein [Paenibacillus harenae]MDQ0111694.1 hypothetical protein [Paenibacillus harenae]
MNSDRRQIVVREIEHWRRSKLLPDQYCDFLLNLYADQDMDSQSSRSSGGSSHARKAVAAVQQATGMQWFLTFGTFTLISFVVFYFSVFHPLLQIGVIVLGAVVLLWLGQRLRRHNEAAGLAITGIGMLLLLGGGLFMFSLHEISLWWNQVALLGFCALLWIAYGIKAHIPVLHLCGWITSILVYAWLLSHYTGEAKWYEIQLYWLPLACLFGWGSWFVHRWRKAVSAVFFVTCALVWFMPELYAMLFSEDEIIAWLQLQLIVKIAVGGGLLFLMRKKWMVWIV